MSKHITWLAEQIELWVKQGIVSREQATAIRSRYPDQKAGLPWGLLVFAGLGTVIVGLGVILLFAYNWHAMPRAAKLAVVLVSIAGAHSAGVFLSRYTDWRRQLGDALCLLGTMLFGAGIWLVAQMYNIDEHYPNGFLIWCLGALAMAWAMPSIAQGMLATVLVTVWVCSEACGFKMPVTWAPLLIIAAIGSLAWRLRSRALLLVVLISLFVTMIAVTCIVGGMPFALVMNTAALFIAAGILAEERGWFVGSGPVWAAVGWPVFIVCMYILTFKDVVHDIMRYADPEREGYAVACAVYAWLPFVLMLAAWAMVAWTRFTRPRPAGTIQNSYLFALVPVAMLVCQFVARADLERSEQVPAVILFNLVFLALAFAWMGRGCQCGSVKQTTFGSIMFVALAFGRYFDLFESLAVRGLVFLLVGALLIAEGIFFMRGRKHARSAEVHQ